MLNEHKEDKGFTDFYLVKDHGDNPQECLTFYTINPGYVDKCEHVDYSTADNVKGYGYNADAMGYFSIMALCEECLKKEQEKKASHADDVQDFIDKVNPTY